MKNLRITILALALLALATACNRNKRHVVISEGSDKGSLRIEYYGRALFNYDSTAIARITPHGKVKYSKDDQKVTAENGTDGRIVYRFNGGSKKTELSPGDKLFLESAVKDMIKHGHYNDPKH
jgi:hypothetical protein